MNRTSISWTDFSSNPIYAVDRETGRRGWFCEKVSPGCAACYASALNVRRGTSHEYLPENRDKVEFRLNERELEAILRRRKPARIFVGDMLDLFYEDVPDAFIAAIFGVMATASRHTFQVLTKRPERMRALLTSQDFWNKVGALGPPAMPQFTGGMVTLGKEFGAGLRNVHLGVSVENQRMLEERWTHLRATPAAVRFLSCEPLLGPLDFQGEWFEDLGEFVWPDWCVVGGESAGPPERRLVERCVQPWHDINMRLAVCDRCAGTGWRPKPEALAWVRSIRDQAVVAGTAFYFKGWAGPRPTSGGRLLDGRMWDEMPSKEA